MAGVLAGAAPWRLPGEPLLIRSKALVHRFASLGLLVLTLPVPGRAQPVGGSADTLQLDFGWPVGLEAVVEIERYRVRSTPGGADTSVIAGRYEMRVAKHPAGLRVIHQGRVLPPLSAEAGRSALLDRISEYARAMPPGAVVGRDAEFLESSGEGDLLALLESLASTAAEGGQGAPGRSELERLLPEDLLRGIAESQWNTLVGFWMGTRLPLGEVHEVQRTQELAFLAGMEVTVVFRYRAVGRVPCSDTEPGAACVELRLFSFPDPDTLRHLLRRTTRELGGTPDDREMEFGELQIETSVRLVAEPATLIPHRLEILRRVQGTVPLDRGRLDDFGLLERTLQRYRY